MTLPTSPELDRLAAELARRCRPYFRAERTIARLRALQVAAMQQGSRTTDDRQVIRVDFDRLRKPDGPEAA